MLDSKAPPFSVHDKLYSDQLKLDLAINVYKNGQWGCYILHKLDFGLKVPVQKAVLCHRVIDQETIELDWVQDGTNGYDAETTDSVYVQYATYAENTLHEAVKVEENGVAVRTPVEVPNPHKVTTLGLKTFQDHASFFIFAGRNESHRSIVGVAFQNVISNVVSSKDCISWTVPEGWTLELATASILPYLAVRPTL